MNISTAFLWELCKEQLTCTKNIKANENLALVLFLLFSIQSTRKQNLTENVIHFAPVIYEYTIPTAL